MPVQCASPHMPVQCAILCATCSYGPRVLSAACARCSQEMLHGFDTNKDGKVDFDEFYRIMKKKNSNPLDDLDDDDE